MSARSQTIAREAPNGSVELTQMGTYSLRDGHISGGYACGDGFNIRWRYGPGGGESMDHDGATVEQVLHACNHRILEFQSTPLAHPAFDEACCLIQQAIEELDSRTKARIEAGVYGSNDPGTSKT